jgi:hypothetical protein
MKLSTLVIQLAVCGQLTSAFSPLLQTTRSGSISGSQRVVRTTQSRIFSSQWDEEDDDDTPLEKATSFEDAGVALQDAEDKKQMDGMGDYDANPSVSYFKVMLAYLHRSRDSHSLFVCILCCLW